MANGYLFPGQSIKRKAYFAFYFDDIMRVNNVRNAWKIGHPDGSLNRSFYDSSLWESKKLQNDEAIKSLIRTGVGYTSTVCVLVGTGTWQRRWVQYEIARSVIDGRGLLAVHINGLKHHQTLQTSPKGINPISRMGLARKENTKVYLCQKIGDKWQWYEDYTEPVSVPKYLTPPDNDHVRVLTEGTYEYDYVAQLGHKNIGAWIDLAAQEVGR